MTRRVRLEDLVGRLVRDQDGRPVGHVWEIIGEERAGSLEVTEYHLGPAALMERASLRLGALLGVRRSEPKRIAWNKLDVSDPAHPVFLGDADD